jgi:signal transduction histidine kinase
MAHRVSELTAEVGPKLTSRILRHSQIILESAERLNRLMDELLLLGRVESGQMQLKVGLTFLSAFAQEVVREASLAGHEERLHLTVDPATWKEFPLDGRMIRHVLLNLISNALKYSPPDKPVTLHLHPTEDRRLEFAVQDHGVGIPEADQAKLFRPFFRAGNVERRPGTGIGLKIARECARLHGGDLTCESLVGVGSTFFLRLPALSTAVEAKPSLTAG